MSTQNVNFVVQNNQTALDGTYVIAPPYVQAFDHQTATSLSGRGPGGAAYQTAAGVGSNNIVMIDDVMTRLDKLGYGKNGALLLVTNASLACTVSLSATTTVVTNAISVSTAGDITFAAWNQLIFLNLSSADMTIAPNELERRESPGPSERHTPYRAPGSPVVLQSVVGETVNASHANIVVTPTNGGNFCIAIGGA